ncbi:MAG: hypothetical protein JSV91_07000 [Phycisphaerales bacterium]|nr:MAG: hypothetical protein JSV91_07000 [Phycisphaerales bacterium]
MFELWIPLLVQAIFAVLGIELFRRRVLRGLGSVGGVGGAGLVLDVWGPIALVLPLLFHVGWIEGRVAGVGWSLAGGPVACGLLALGIAGITGLDCGKNRQPKAPAIAAWTGAGLILLLQSAAGEMTLWTGQCTFAAAAVLMWMNTPGAGPEHETADGATVRTGWALVLAVLCAAGQGCVALYSDIEIRPWVAAVSLAYATVVLALAARTAGGGACVRLGGWAATYGVLFGMGLISLCALVPEVYHIVADGWMMSEHRWPRPPIASVAYGFGTFAVEGTLLLMLGGLAAAAARTPESWRRIAGAIVLLGAAALIVCRLMDGAGAFVEMTGPG